jgi:hypothetical protein
VQPCTLMSYDRCHNSENTGELSPAIVKEDRFGLHEELLPSDRG